ncbi:MAG: hypothetical protein AABZ06_07590 [Bdellovibrionota bacterium]
MDIGFMHVAWGETFGFNIVDLINPRDYSDPLFLESIWVKLPVFALNMKYISGSLTIQGIVIPVPRHNILPETDLPVDLRDFNIEDIGHDSEVGAKINYLFDSGLDLGFIYFYHWNRNIVLELKQDRRLNLIEDRIHSLGVTASHLAGNYVFRADSIMHIDQPAQVGFGFQHGTNWQTILGADTTSETQWTLGAQYHMDRSVTDTFHWTSVRLRKPFFSEAIVVETFLFRGLNNKDTWLQPQLTWNISASTSLIARLDLLVAGDAGILPSFKDSDRAFAWFSYKF